MPKLPLTQHPILHFRNKYLHHKVKNMQFPEGRTIVNMDGVKFPCDLSLGKMARSMYCGSFDYEIKRLLLKHLKPGDTFIDVGANVGYFSAVAATKVGSGGQIHAFEPVPCFFQSVQQFKELNPQYQIVLNQCALGDSPCRTKIYENRENMGGHSILKGFVGDLLEQEHEIDVIRLDDYIEDKGLENISLIKIDTEGYEYPVLLGMQRYFEKTSQRPLIIAEISPKSFAMLGHELKAFEEYVTRYSYQIYAICGCHKIDITKIDKQTNILLLPK